MQELDNKTHSHDFDDEIALRELFFVLVKGRWIITFMTAFFFDCWNYL